MKKKKSFLDILSLILMITIAVCAVAFIGSGREWFATKTETYNLVTSETQGSVSIIRRGSGYSLKKDIGLVEGDGVLTAQESSADFDVKNSGSFFLNENSEMSIISCKDGAAEIELKGGSFYFDIDQNDTSFTADAVFGSLSAEKGSVFSAEVMHGTQTIRVYKGNVSILPLGNSESRSLCAGQMQTIVQDEDGKSVFLEISSISPQAMNSFLLERTLEDERELCLTRETLGSEIARREKETEDARIAREQYEAEIKAKGGTVPVVVISGGDIVNPEPAQNIGSDVMTCLISIRCDTILDNMADLSLGKEEFVPANGIILDTVRVQFAEGESVCDVLRRVCAYANIQLEYSWTVAFGGYYFEGINNLYEFDCGPQSGWMYKVNGWFPNYGSSNYILKDGDEIVWAYTCKGIGADLGAVYSN